LKFYRTYDFTHISLEGILQIQSDLLRLFIEEVRPIKVILSAKTLSAVDTLIVVFDCPKNNTTETYLTLTVGRV